MEELVDEFDAFDPSGRVVRLYVYQSIIDAGSFGDPHATIRGLSRVETEDGDGVNVNDDGSYLVVARDLRLTR